MVLRPTHAPAHAEVLNRLQIQRRTWNLGGFGTDARDDLINANFALAEGLELTKHAGSASPAAAASEGCDGIDGRVLQNNFSELAHLLGHGGKGQVLVALDEPIEAAGILLREEALRSIHKEIHIQANRAEGDQENEELMAENPA